MQVDPEYRERAAMTINRLWQAIQDIKRRRGREHELDQLETLVKRERDWPLLVMELNAVLAEELARLQQELDERVPPQ